MNHEVVLETWALEFMRELKKQGAELRMFPERYGIPITLSTVTKSKI
jgi:hypothetical protein